jgi:hypothetical protein
MDILGDEFNLLAPVTDAEIALLRMPKLERLPRYKRNSLEVGEDCDNETKNQIRRNGLPQSWPHQNFNNFTPVIFDRGFLRHNYDLLGISAKCGKKAHGIRMV